MSNVNGAGNDYDYYGGIRFNKSEVQSSKSKNGVDFEVQLKNGQKLIFGDQGRNGRKDPSVTAFTEGGIAYLMGMDLSNVNVIGNPNKKDNIRISGEHNKVYVNNDSYSDEVHTRSKNFSSDNNRVAIGKNDTWIDGNNKSLHMDNNGKYKVSDSKYM